MKRKHINFLVDSLAFTAFVLMTSTGVIMRYLLPPGSGRHTTIWALDRHEWVDVHFWLAVVFFSVLALHLVLHWRWIVCMIKGRSTESSGFRLGLGLLGALTVLIIAVSPLLAPVEKELGANTTASHESHETDEFTIRGAMTLQDIEKTTGVPAAFILRALRLPETTSSGEKLSVLRNKYGFKMKDVREAVFEYQNAKRRE